MNFNTVPQMLLVGALDENGALWVESTGGATAAHLFAPGVDVAVEADDGLSLADGTSPAAAQVAGVLAALFSYVNQFSAAFVNAGFPWGNSQDNLNSARAILLGLSNLKGSSYFNQPVVWNGAYSINLMNQYIAACNPPTNARRSLLQRITHWLAPEKRQDVCPLPEAELPNGQGIFTGGTDGSTTAGSSSSPPATTTTNGGQAPPQTTTSTTTSVSTPTGTPSIYVFYVTTQAFGEDAENDFFFFDHPPSISDFDHSTTDLEQGDEGDDSKMYCQNSNGDECDPTDASRTLNNIEYIEWYDGTTGGISYQMTTCGIGADARIQAVGDGVNYQLLSHTTGKVYADCYVPSNPQQVSEGSENTYTGQEIFRCPGSCKAYDSDN